ncbi:hypothetical protein C0Q70_03761 [Pomacea canaliculata]|uniref:Transporter n=1 Tax=Pomacea canaliculata TaxID=400727 RepID=A0A2T7PTL7_POMCA|nr:hypothetical protein C0Q70_03761 [Pomacea canaliculata]
MALPSSKGSYNLWEKDTHKSTSTSLPQPTQGHLHLNDERQEPDKPESDEPDRGQWGHKAEFILSCIGLSVGLGNIWRFPYLAYEYGGAAFLLAYLILQLLIGKPLYFMELVMGQYTGKGPTKCWEMNPAAKGIGISMCMVSLVVSIYYNIIVAYTIYYLFSSMQATLPWTQCKPEWVNCISERNHPAPVPCTTNITVMENLTACQCTKNSTIDNAFSFNCTPKYRTSTELFFYNEVIQKSDGMEPDKMGAPVWKLALSLLLAWILVAVCLAKGIKTSGKVVYFTATFPYVVLLILLIRGCLLEGAVDGVLFFIVPKWERLTDINVWVAAAGQMFFSLSVSFGGIIMFGSYNKFTNQLHGDAVVVSSMDLVTSVIAGFVVFTTFGHMARKAGIPIEQVAQSGYGLAFVAYPEALSNLPVPQLWSVIFFFMLFSLGLDSEFGLMETVLTCLHDEFPKLRKWKVQFMFTYRMVQYKSPTISDDEPFPHFAQSIGWALLTFVLCPIPLWFFYHAIRTFYKNDHLTTSQKIKKIFSPTKRWLPADGSKSSPDSSSGQEMEDKYGVDNPALFV